MADLWEAVPPFTMPLQPESEVTLTIEKPVAGGRMLARHEGQVVFVAGAIPGERVRARVERVSKQLAFAETIDVLEASPERRPAIVDWACGGSLYSHIAYERQLALKSETVSDSFARIGKIQLPGPVPVMPSEEHGYRMRARLHAQQGTFGFFREGTHDLCDAAATRQLLPATIDALERLQQSVTEAGIDVFRARSQRTFRRTSVRCCSRWTQSKAAPLHLEPIEGISGVLFADHQSSRLTVAYGSPYVTDRISGLETAQR